ncbi:MAG: helix-turn-helix domain-containing protein [Acidobacteriia bacterium]|nr:helix-turn-helix domain-containing protein [Terriglobia bacterium]
MAHNLLRIPSVARLLSVSEASTRRLIRAGVIPSIRVGRQIRVDEEVLREWMNRGGAGGWSQEVFRSGTDGETGAVQNSR